MYFLKVLLYSIRYWWWEKCEDYNEDKYERDYYKNL